MTVRGRPRHPDVLTPREWVVFRLLRDGLKNEEIAERLGITLDGAKYHVSSILSKLGVPSRIEASRWQPQRMQTGRRGWSFILGIGKMAGIAVAASAILGVGALGYGVLVTEVGHEGVDQTSASALDTGGSLGGDEGQAAGAPSESSSPPGDATPRPPFGPAATGEALGLIVIPTPTAVPGEETPGGSGGTIEGPPWWAAPVPTHTPQATQAPCAFCEPKPTPTPTPAPQLSPPPCELCHASPAPAGNDGTSTPNVTINPTRTRTPVLTPTPTATPPPSEPDEPDEQETEQPHPSVTLEPTETPEPDETTEPVETPEADHS